MVRHDLYARCLVLGVASPCLAGLLLTIWWSDTPAPVVPLRVDESEARDEALPRSATAVAREDAPPRAPGLASSRTERRLVESETLDAALEAVARHRARRSLDMLTWFARNAEDARVRIRAMRALADLFGAQARPILREAFEDSQEPDKVRREAARLVGCTGEGAARELDDLIESDLPPRVRGGAVLGLSELGTEASTTRVFALAAASEHSMRLEAGMALGRMYAPNAARRLAAIMTDESARPTPRLPEAARIAVCRSLGRAGVWAAERPLTDLLMMDTSAAVRATAAHALGILGNTEVTAALMAAREDRGTGVAAAAHLALSRLSHAR